MKVKSLWWKNPYFIVVCSMLAVGAIVYATATQSGNGNGNGDHDGTQGVYYAFFGSLRQGTISLRTADIPDVVTEETLQSLTWSSLREVDIALPVGESLDFGVEYHADMFHLIITQGGTATVRYFTSEDGYTWTFMGNVLTDIPPGYYSFKRIEILYANGAFHAWVCAQGGSRDTLYYRSTSGFDSLEYVGVAMSAGVRPQLSAGALLTSVWYNGMFHGYVGGSSTSAGSWHYIFHARSSDGLSWTLDASPLIYNKDDFPAGSWANGHIYPPRGVWVDGVFNAVGCGCDLQSSRNTPPDNYDHDPDWFITDSATDISVDNWMGGTASTSYWEDNPKCGVAKIIAVFEPSVEP